MKLIAFLLTTAVATGTASSPEEYLRRTLQVSNTSSACYNETEAIGTDPDWQSAIQTATASYCEQAITMSQTTNNRFTFNIDYSECDPAFTESINQACTTAGGQPVSGAGDVSLSCSGNGVEVTMEYKNTPSCIGASCDLSIWESEKKQVQAQNLEQAKAMMNGMEGMPSGLQCTFNSAGKVTGVLAFAITSAAAILLF